MAAPKGNKNALGNHGGQPTKYKPEYCDKIIEYFNVPPQQVVYKETYNADGSLKSKEPIVLPAQFPTFQGFANDICDVSMMSMMRWCDEHIEFREAYSRAKAIQEKILLINSTGKLYDSQFSQFFAKNCLGYRDKTELAVDATVSRPYQGLTAEEIRAALNEEPEAKQ
jgi:hypothetical protein